MPHHPCHIEIPPRLTSASARRRAGAAALALCLAAAAACRGDGPGAPAREEPTGVYTLAEINGRPLPTAAYDGPFTWEDGVSAERLTVKATAGAVALTRDGKVIDWVDLDFDADGATWSLRPVVLGTYTVRGDSITIDEPPDFKLPGTARGGTLRIVQSFLGQTTEFVYRR